MVLFAGGGFDADDMGLAARRLYADRVAQPYRSAHNASTEAAKLGIGPVDPLHRQAEGPDFDVAGDLDGFEMLHDGRPDVPGHSRAGDEDIVAVARHDRDALNVMDPEPSRHRQVLRGDLGEALLVESDQIHFVVRQHDVADTEKAEDGAVAAGLRDDTLPR